MAKSIHLKLPERRSAIIDSIADVFSYQVLKRCGSELKVGERGELSISLELAPGIGAEGFRIESGPKATVRVIGNDELGLLHGVGKLLRTSRFAPGEFLPGTWQGTSVPQKPVRGIYFATHFHNFYHDGPVAENQRYVEELGLWGYNALAVWFDMHHYNGIDDPAAQAMIERLRAILAAAKRVGMKTGLTTLANEAYANSPKELRSDPNTHRAHYGVELCPSKPGAIELTLKWHEERLEAFADLEPDYLWVWPYDQGGCACKDCAPWGANGFLRIAEPVARLYRRYFSKGKVVFSTWLYDMHKDEGEWRGLTKAFERRPDWVDYVMVESHAEFPRYPLEHGVPGGLPMVNFPEISMRGMWPWGGFGANPIARWFQHLWDVAGAKLSGGFPYSEGIFEDINKAVCAQFYWKESTKAMDTVREYAAFECSPDVADDVTRAIDILEKNHERGWTGFRDGRSIEPVVMPKDQGAEEALALLQKADGRLTEAARKAWRWRILLLRGVIDVELYRTGGMVTEKCEGAFEELKRIFHADGAEAQVHPPTAEMRESSR